MFRTLAGHCRVEIERVKASRFIADAAPIQSPEDALAFRDQIAEAFPDATHHCFAWRMYGDDVRAADDGEPGGTAGKPILNRIISAELECVVVVVTRYYGGTNLGTGGLIRAYGAAAAAVLDEATVVEQEPKVVYRVTHDYALSGAVQGVLSRVGAEIQSSTYQLQVELEVSLPAHEEAAFVTAMRDETAGRAQVEPVAI